MKVSITVKENVTRRLGLLEGNLGNGLINGLTAVLDKSTKAMQQQVRDAVTETGSRRAAGLEPLYRPRPAWWSGRGPGRIESGRMYNAIGWTLTASRNGAKARGGFIFHPPGYLKLQEKGTGSGGKRHQSRGIPPMLSYAKGKAVAAALLSPTLDNELAKAVRAANNGRTWGRA